LISPLITTTGSASFNALNGNVGMLANPINVVTPTSQIFAGAGPQTVATRAVFIGVASDNTVHAIPSNPPCIIDFNGVEIKTCIPVVPPRPTVNVPSPGLGLFYVQGIYSQRFSLAGIEYYFSDRVDKHMVDQAHALMYYIRPQSHEFFR
jgi:hypothetical protein